MLIVFRHNSTVDGNNSSFDRIYILADQVGHSMHCLGQRLQDMCIYSKSNPKTTNHGLNRTKALARVAARARETQLCGEKFIVSVCQSLTIVIITRFSFQKGILLCAHYEHKHINVSFTSQTIRGIHKINESFIVCFESLSTYLVLVDER